MSCYKLKRARLLTSVIIIVLLILISITIFTLEYNKTLAVDLPQDEEASLIVEPRIIYSKTAGFYNENFDLQLSYSDQLAQIYYTLDGSVPTIIKGIEYIEPIIITLKEKETVYTIRSVAVIAEQYVSPVETVTYIVSANVLERFTTAVVSITTDPANLNNAVTGIFAKKNLQMHGREYERPAHIEFFEPDGTIKLSQNCGIKVFGGATRNNPQKSLKIFARKEYDSPGKFEFEAFPGLRGRYTDNLIMSFDKLQLRSSGNDNNITMLRDAFMQQLAKNNDIDYQEYRPTSVYLNGKYWGILNLREDTNATYIEEHYSIPSERVSIIASSLVVNATKYELQEGPESELKVFNDMVKFIRTKNMAVESNYQQASGMIDIDAFIRYMAIQIYYVNTDWPQNNIKAWRYAPDEINLTNQNVYAMDGLWRFILKDTDFGFSLLPETTAKRNSLASTISTNDVFGLGAMLKSLLRNSEFTNKFINYTCDMASDKETPDKVNNILNEMQFSISSELRYHFERWSSVKGVSALDKRMNSWNNEIGKIHLFAQQRPEFLLQHTKSQFKLKSLEKVTIIGSEGGTVILNTVKINIANGEWIGSYFTQIPIPISFIPAEGYIFEGCQLSDNIVIENGFVIINGSNTSITPIFTKDDSYSRPQGALVINEVVASVNNPLNSDWVELYNGTDGVIDLEHYVLTDDINQIDRNRILPSVSIGPNEYVYILCTGNKTDSTKGIINVNFKLSKGETIYLLDLKKAIVDKVEINTNLAFGRQYNNLSKFVTFSISSPGTANSFSEFALYKFPGLNNRILVNGTLKGENIKVVIVDGVIFVEENNVQTDVQDYANRLNLSFVYIPQYNSIIFSKVI